MKKILVPLDGTIRSLAVFDQIKRSFPPDKFELFLIMIHDSFEYTLTRIESDKVLKEMEEKLNSIAENLTDYTVHKRVTGGKPGPRIIEYAEEIKPDLILMTRSTGPGVTKGIGSTAKYVLSRARYGVYFVNGAKDPNSSEYRGLVYKKASSVVNLRGQLSQKHSECLLPIAYGKLVYRIDVTRGRVRFIHRAYNEKTNEWDICPEGGLEENIEISAGEVADITIEVRPNKKPDRVRVVNRGMKTEAVFAYDIKILKRYKKGVD